MGPLTVDFGLVEGHRNNVRMCFYSVISVGLRKCTPKVDVRVLFLLGTSLHVRMLIKGVTYFFKFLMHSKFISTTRLKCFRFKEQHFMINTRNSSIGLQRLCSCQLWKKMVWQSKFVFNWKKMNGNWRILMSISHDVSFCAASIQVLVYFAELKLFISKWKRLFTFFPLELECLKIPGTIFIHERS